MHDSTADQVINELIADLGYPTPHQIHQGRHLMVRRSQMKAFTAVSSGEIGSSWNRRCFS